MVKLIYDYQAFAMQEYGGISRYVYELATHLSCKEEFAVEVVAPLYINKYLAKSSFDVSGFSVPNIRRTERIIDKLNTELSRAWLSTKAADIVHETYYHPKKLASSGTKTVTTVHDMIHEKFSHLLAKDNLSERKQRAVNRADHVICVSENTKKDLIEIFKIDPAKISVVYHGCSLSNHALSMNEQELSGKSDPNKFVVEPFILYVGSKWQYKNFPRLLRAYANSHQLRDNFSLVCFGSKSFSKDELNLIDELKLPLNKVISLTGDDFTLSRLYKAASAFVYPSLYEGFGIPLLEAMSLNCPIACSDTSCFPEIADTAAEFFNPYSVDEMSNAIENVVCSPTRSDELIALGKQRFKAFSWATCATQTANIYASLL